MISIEAMEFYAYHGCFAEEKQIGTHFVVDLHFENDTTRAETSDNIDDTVDYYAVYQTVKGEMAISSNLLETLAHRIAERLFDSYSDIYWLQIKIQKMNPPLGGKMKSVGFMLEKERE
jgi:dihydroneopterin aldolase